MKTALLIAASLISGGESLSKLDGTATYERVFNEIKSTKQHRIVLFTRGLKHAQQIAHLQAILRAAGREVPHVIDLEVCDPGLVREWGRPAGDAYLMAIHPPREGFYSHGPTYFKVSAVRTIERFDSWANQNANQLKLPRGKTIVRNQWN